MSRCGLARTLCLCAVGGPEHEGVGPGCGPTRQMSAYPISHSCKRR